MTTPKEIIQKQLNEIVDSLKWLLDDEKCPKEHKLPIWAKSHIEDMIEDLNCDDHEKALKVDKDSTLGKMWKDEEDFA